MLVCCFFPGTRVQVLIVTNLASCFSWFWKSTWQIQWYTHVLPFHTPYFCTKHWHSGVWRKPAGRKGSASSCGGAEAWQFLGWRAMKDLVLFCYPHWAALHLSSSCGFMRAVCWECVCGGGFHPAVTGSAKCNITTVVALCGLCVCSVALRRKGPALLSIFFLSLPDMQHFSFNAHLTCLCGSSVSVLMN